MPEVAMHKHAQAREREREHRQSYDFNQTLIKTTIYEDGEVTLNTKVDRDLLPIVLVTAVAEAEPRPLATR